MTEVSTFIPDSREVDWKGFSYDFFLTASLHVKEHKNLKGNLKLPLMHLSECES